MISNKFTSKGRRPFPTRLRKTLRRYWGARVSSACCARLQLAAAAAAPSPRRCGWKTVFITEGNSLRQNIKMAAISAISFGWAGKHEGRGSGLLSYRSAPA